MMLYDAEQALAEVEAVYGREAAAVVNEYRFVVGVKVERALELCRVAVPEFRAAVERHMVELRARADERQVQREAEARAEEAALRRRTLQTKIIRRNQELDALATKIRVRDPKLAIHAAAEAARETDAGKALLVQIAEAERDLAEFDARQKGA